MLAMATRQVVDRAKVVVDMARVVDRPQVRVEHTALPECQHPESTPHRLDSRVLQSLECKASG